MSIRTATFFKALAEKAQAEKRVVNILLYHSATVAFEVREKQVLTDLFDAIKRRANAGFTSLSTTEEPALKRIEIQAYMKKQGFTFHGCDAVVWDTSDEELK